MTSLFRRKSPIKLENLTGEYIGNGYIIKNGKTIVGRTKIYSKDLIEHFLSEKDRINVEVFICLLKNYKNDLFEEIKYSRVFRLRKDRINLINLAINTCKEEINSKINVTNYIATYDKNRKFQGIIETNIPGVYPYQSGTFTEDGFFSLHTHSGEEMIIDPTFGDLPPVYNTGTIGDIIATAIPGGFSVNTPRTPSRTVNYKATQALKRNRKNRKKSNRSRTIPPRY